MSYSEPPYQQHRWLWASTPAIMVYIEAQHYKTWPRGYKTWVQSQTQNKAQWLSASTKSLRFILSLRMNSSFITMRLGLHWGTTPEGMTYSEAPHRQVPLIVSPHPRRHGLWWGTTPSGTADSETDRGAQRHKTCSRCHGFVCSWWLWYFLIILTNFE